MDIKWKEKICVILPANWPVRKGGQLWLDMCEMGYKASAFWFHGGWLIIQDFHWLINNKSWMMKQRRKARIFDISSWAARGFICFQKEGEMLSAGMTAHGHLLSSWKRRIGHLFALLTYSTETLVKTFNYRSCAMPRAFSQFLGALCWLPFYATFNLADVVSEKTHCFPVFPLHSLDSSTLCHSSHEFINTRKKRCSFGKK